MGTINPRVLAVLCILCAFCVLCIAMSLFPPAAHAQAACTDYKTLQSTLADKAHEQPVGAGLMGDKNQFAWTLFTSPKGETWTMVVIDAKGMACVVGGGSNWVDLGAAKGDPT